MVAHVVGNWHQPDVPSLTGWLLLGVGLVGVMLRSLRPGIVFAHWRGASRGFGRRRNADARKPLAPRRSGGGRDFPRLWELADSCGFAARWLLLVFYAFAAFAKLNSAFFDPSASCAVYYANESLSSWGLHHCSGIRFGASRDLGNRCVKCRSFLSSLFEGPDISASSSVRVFTP